MSIDPNPQLDMSIRSRSPAGRRGLLAMLLASIFSIGTGTLTAEQVPVRHLEGVTHGFLVLSTLKGRQLASGELIQNASGNRVTSRLLFHFPDGSVHDETSVFLQRRRFRLLTYHLIQKGRTFKQPLEVAIDQASGRVTVHTVDDDGEPKTHTEKMKLPDDLANGIILTLLKNILPESPSTTVSMLAAGPKPRLVKLIITPTQVDAFATAGAGRQALVYQVKVDIPGMAGLIAPLIGKHPPDSHVWILSGEAPAFVKSESPMFAEGPLWRMELVSPVWPMKKKK
jgi:hypothetical protein